MLWTILAIVFGIWFLGFAGLLVFAASEQHMTFKEKVYIAALWPYVICVLWLSTKG
ncbi:MAG: hypothetical protein M0R80_02255 [Proteobacteria bacterium]|jgi:ABC-type uncharacterized transport system permease subunit|nr:hypothetical protein [Pseudomonadota bacterium]